MERQITNGVGHTPAIAIVPPQADHTRADPTRAARPCRLMWLTEGGARGVFELRGVPRLVIGHGNGADIRLDAPTVAPRHAALTFFEGEYTLTDLGGSGHGVHLNGVKVHAATLRDGDVVQLAGAVLTFEEA